MKTLEELQKNPRFEEAQRHARNLRGFYTHALIYVLVAGGLLALNMTTSPNRFWSGYAMLGWGIGVIAHGASVFAGGGWFGPDWEERKIRQYLDRRA